MTGTDLKPKTAAGQQGQGMGYGKVDSAEGLRFSEKTSS